MFPNLLKYFQYHHQWLTQLEAYLFSTLHNKYKAQEKVFLMVSVDFNLGSI